MKTGHFRKPVINRIRADADPAVQVSVKVNITYHSSSWNLRQEKWYMTDVTYATLIYHSFSSRGRLGVGCSNTEMRVVISDCKARPKA